MAVCDPFLSIHNQLGFRVLGFQGIRFQGLGIRAHRRSEIVRKMPVRDPFLSIHKQSYQAQLHNQSSYDIFWLVTFSEICITVFAFIRYLFCSV